MFVLSSPLVFACALILKHLGSKMMCALPPTFLDVGKNRELSSELLVLRSLPCAPRQLFSLALPEYTCELQALSSDDHVWLSWTKKLGGETVCVTTRPTKTALRAKGLVFPNTWPDPVICLRVFDFALRLADAAPGRAGLANHRCVYIGCASVREYDASIWNPFEWDTPEPANAKFTFSWSERGGYRAYHTDYVLFGKTHLTPPYSVLNEDASQMDSDDVCDESEHEGTQEREVWDYFQTHIDDLEPLVDTSQFAGDRLEIV